MRALGSARAFFYFCVVLSLVLVAWPWIDPGGVATRMRLARQEQQLQSELRDMRRRVEELQRLNQRLQTDLGLIEKIAREQLMYARPDEQVIPLPNSEPVEEDDGDEGTQSPGPRPPTDR